MVSGCQLQSNHSHPPRSSLINSLQLAIASLLCIFYIVSSSDVIDTLASQGAKLYAHQKLAVLFSRGPTATYLLTRGSCPSPVESLTVGWLFGRALDIALGDPASAVNGEGSQLLIHQLHGALAEQLDWTS